jgi:hypothetical protein
LEKNKCNPPMPKSSLHPKLLPTASYVDTLIRIF